jgi:hypothetical protein
MKPKNGSPVTIVCLDRIQLNAVLLRFEDDYYAASGHRLSSPEFYERYKAGEIDEIWAMAWSTYYERYLEMEKQLRAYEDAEVAAVVDSLPPVLA